MKKSSILVYVTCALVLAGGFMALCARVRSANSERQFDDIFKDSRLAFVLFYKSGKEEQRDSEMRKKIKDTVDAFEALGARGRYNDAELAFIKVNCTRPELEELAKEYGIEGYPSFIVFNEDGVVEDYFGSPVVLTGFMLRTELKSFIEDNLGSHIGKILKQKDDLVKRRREEAQVSWVPYYYPYDYYYPYWDFYERSPSYSPGIGFGYSGHVRSRAHRDGRDHRQDQGGQKKYRGQRGRHSVGQ